RRHTRSKRDWSSDVCSSDLRPSREAVAVAASPNGRMKRKLGGREALAPQLRMSRSRSLASPHLDVVLGRPAATGTAPAPENVPRSEERRVGKGGRARWRAGE